MLPTIFPEMPMRSPVTSSLRVLATAFAVLVPGAAGQTAAGQTAAQTAAQPVAYAIDARASTIVYDMRHPTHGWTGTSRAVSGSLLVGAGGAVVGGTVTAPVASFDSGNRNRDSNMLEVTGAATYRAITFQAVRVTPLALPTADVTATVEGVLTFHGVRQAVRVPVKAEAVPGGVRLQGRFAVTLTQFRIDAPRLLGVRVDDRIGLALDLVARRP